VKARAAALILAVLLPAACAPESLLPDTAILPPGVFGAADQDVPAMEYAEYVFSDSSRTYGNPAAGARAVLAMDYLAGALATSPRWANVGPETKFELLQAREQTRAAAGIAPNARSQAVVNSLVVASSELQAGDLAKAAAALNNPAFTGSPEQTLQRLANLPYLQMANISTNHAANEMFEPGDSGT